MVNPFTKLKVSVARRTLTPEQQRALRGVVASTKRMRIDKDCDLLTRPDGAYFVIVGLEAWCEHDCKFSVRQLDVANAKLALELATAASMTIAYGDAVYIPAGVKSDHAGETYAKNVATPAELSRVIVAEFSAGLDRYQGPVGEEVPPSK
jgi:hypothetical protein